VTVLDCVSKIARLSGSDGFGPRLPGLRGRRVSKPGPDELSDIGGFGRGRGTSSKPRTSCVARMHNRIPSSSSAEADDPVFQRCQWWNR